MLRKLLWVWGGLFCEINVHYPSYCCAAFQKNGIEILIWAEIFWHDHAGSVSFSHTRSSCSCCEHAVHLCVCLFFHPNVPLFSVGNRHDAHSQNSQRCQTDESQPLQRLFTQIDMFIHKQTHARIMQAHRNNYRGCYVSHSASFFTKKIARFKM